MGGTGDGGLSESLLRDDHPRLVLGRVSNEPGEQLPWGWPCAFHTLSAVVGIAGLVWHCVRLHADPCQGTAAEQLCGPDGPVGDKYWLLKAGVLLSTWELLLQGGYFVSAAGCDWMVGHEATLLGLKRAASDVAGSGLLPPVERGERLLGPHYKHTCCGWRFHLARLDAKSERTLRWRDHCFSLVYTVCMVLLIFYWAVVFPTQSDVREDVLKGPVTFMINLLVHGWSAFVLNVELVIVHHVNDSLMRDMLFLLTFGVLYGVGVFVAHELTTIVDPDDGDLGVWPYPAVQRWAHQNMGTGLVLYGGAALTAFLIALLLRVVNNRIWRRRIVLEMKHVREVGLHQAALGGGRPSY